MNDFFNQQIEIGDVVAFIRKDYRDFSLGTVSKLGPSKVTITFFEGDKLCKTYRDYSSVICKPEKPLEAGYGM